MTRKRVHVPTARGDSEDEVLATLGTTAFRPEGRLRSLTFLAVSPDRRFPRFSRTLPGERCDGSPGFGVHDEVERWVLHRTQDDAPIVTTETETVRY
jgi:hypothetical protein